jgi:hypothetical protein
MRFISHRCAIKQLKRIFNQAPIRLCLRILQGLSRGFPPRPSHSLQGALGQRPELDKPVRGMWWDTQGASSAGLLSFGGEIHADDQAVIASGILELKTKRYSLER